MCNNCYSRSLDFILLPNRVNRRFSQRVGEKYFFAKKPVLLVKHAVIKLEKKISFVTSYRQTNKMDKMADALRGHDPADIQRRKFI